MAIRATEPMAAHALAKNFLLRSASPIHSRPGMSHSHSAPIPNSQRSPGAFSEALCSLLHRAESGAGNIIGSQ